MIRVTVTHARKVPDPTQDFATRSFAASIVGEVCETNSEAVIQRIHALWNDLQRAVDQRVEALQVTGSNGNGHQADGNGSRNGNGYHAAQGSPPFNGNGNGNGNGRPASQRSNGGNGLSVKQKNFLLSLSAKRSWRVNRLNEELQSLTGRNEATLHSLSKAEASLAIETLKADK